MATARRALLCYALLACISCLTLFPGFGRPNDFFWDENYHVASAERYLSAVFFMEPHPPLGKLLLALGEKLLNYNSDDSSLIGQVKATSLPPNFSVAGYRASSVFFGVLAHLAFFAFLRALTSALWSSFALSLVFIFDNAQIVHFRGAMLESVQLFFVLCCLTAALRLWRMRHGSAPLFLFFGACLAAALLTKINSAFLFLVALALLCRLRRERIALIAWSGLGFMLVFFGVWRVHFGLMHRVIETLPDQGTFQVSPSYLDEIRAGRSAELTNFVQGLYEYGKFAARYQQGVPELNYCKKEENGSFPMFWPLGGGAISYRWEKDAQGLTRYLYLVANPAAWLIGLLGVGTCFALLVAHLLGCASNIKHLDLSWLLLGSYLLYLGAVLLASGRVFYLYHYFIALNLSWGMFALALQQIRSLGPRLHLSARGRSALSWLAALSAFLCFIYISPLTYYQPLSDVEISQRNLLAVWNVRCKDCASLNPFARPINFSKRTNPDWRLKLGALGANYIEQAWGEPRLNLDDMGSPLRVGGSEFAAGLGVHAYSRIQFALDGKYSLFGAQVGIPDRLAEERSSVEFKIVLDGKTVWKSGTLRKGDPPRGVELDISEKNVLGLFVSDAKDGNAGDHAAWLEPRLKPRDHPQP